MLRQLDVVETYDEIVDSAEYIIAMGDDAFMGGGRELMRGKGKLVKDYISDFFEGNIEEFDENGEEYFTVFEL